MNISINMSSLETDGVSPEDEYGEEVMYAGWNPDISLLLCQQPSHVLLEERSTLTIDLVTEDAGFFLQKMYAYQS